MHVIKVILVQDVNCRIGSLENKSINPFGLGVVNCRIGSLEIPPLQVNYHMLVNCRIGSLETDPHMLKPAAFC